MLLGRHHLLLGRGKASLSLDRKYHSSYLTDKCLTGLAHYYCLVTVAIPEPVQNQRKYFSIVFDYFFSPISLHLLDWKE